MSNERIDEAKRLKKEGINGAQTSVIFIVLAVFFAFASIAGFSRHPVPVYFGLTPDGKVYELPPYDQPHFTDAAVVRFASEVITESYTLSFATWQRDVSRLSQYFDERAYERFVSALDQSIFQKVRNQQLIGTAILKGSPVIIKRGPLVGGDYAGRYAWQIQVPIEVTWRGSLGSVNQSLAAQITVIRSDPMIHPSGMAVARFNVK